MNAVVDETISTALPLTPSPVFSGKADPSNEPKPPSTLAKTHPPSIVKSNYSSEVEATSAVPSTVRSDPIAEHSSATPSTAAVLHTASPTVTTAIVDCRPATSKAGKSTKKSSKRKSPAVTMATATTASSSGSTGGENTGRWTAEEHRLFLQGLDQHGKGWKKIASLIKSRTVVQIRTHAQKYFQKLAKARQNGEDGEVTMDGRGELIGGVSGHVSQGQKKKRQLNGTKRKSIASVVASVSKDCSVPSNNGYPHAVEMMQSAKSSNRAHHPRIPSVAPALQPFIVSPTNSNYSDNQSALTPAVLEESL